MPDKIHVQLLRYLTESYQHQHRQSSSSPLRLVLKVDYETFRKNLPTMTQYVPGSLWEQALLEGQAKGILEGVAKGKIEGEAKEKLITTLEDDLELLTRMSAQELDYDLMRSLSDVPDALLQEFRSAYTAKKAKMLLAQVRQTRELAGLDVIRQHLLDGLLTFGITLKAAQAYVQGVGESVNSK